MPAYANTKVRQLNDRNEVFVGGNETNYGETFPYATKFIRCVTSELEVAETIVVTFDGLIGFDRSYDERLGLRFAERGSRTGLA